MLFNRMLLARIFLTGAILTEVAGTSSMAMIPENEAGWLNYLPMWLLISFSYLLLAKAAKTISIGIAFALWEGLGIALITVVSVPVPRLPPECSGVDRTGAGHSGYCSGDNG
jgi:spermidine export protein MdtJ